MNKLLSTLIISTSMLNVFGTGPVQITNVTIERGAKPGQLVNAKVTLTATGGSGSYTFTAATKKRSFEADAAQTNVFSSIQTGVPVVFTASDVNDTNATSTVTLTVGHLTGLSRYSEIDFALQGNNVNVTTVVTAPGITASSTLKEGANKASDVTMTQDGLKFLGTSMNLDGQTASATVTASTTGLQRGTTIQAAQLTFSPLQAPHISEVSVAPAAGTQALLKETAKPTFTMPRKTNIKVSQSLKQDPPAETSTNVIFQFIKNKYCPQG